MLTWRILVGDVREKLRELPEQSVQCVVTSPPYWGLRNYGVDGQIGMEDTPDEFVDALCSVFDEVWRVLKDDGTIWVNLGDSYLAQQGAGFNGQKRLDHANRNVKVPRPAGIKPKDLAGIPWTVALALRARGWYLRSDIIWSKPNPMPESVTDRPTKSHEYLFLLSKSERYYYDAEAIQESSVIGTSGSGYHMQKRYSEEHQTTRPNGANRVDYSDLSARSGLLTGKTDCVYCSGTGEAYDPPDQTNHMCQNCGGSGTVSKLTRNKRSVWTITTQAYPEAHFATFPEALVEPCIKAGSRVGDLVMDPFTGSGTTGAVAIRLGRSFVGVELNPSYVELGRKRIGSAAPLFATEVA